VNRLSVGIGSTLFVVLLCYSGYRAYSAFRSTQREVSQMRQDLKATKELAQKESAAAAEANQRAGEAARSAAISANDKQHADEERIQAEAQRVQAEAVSKQAELARTQAVTDAQKAVDQAKHAQDEVASLRAERQQELNTMQEALGKLVETQRTPNGMLVILPDSTFRFAFNSADLTQKNRELLSRIAGILLVSKGYGLAVYGYTDDVGSEEYNLSLSERRAKSVEQYLMQAGVPAGIMSTKGYGKSSPRVSNTAPDARAKNRRVELAVTDSQLKY
jgi:outer membrane protein OmpA-like peptidoglycan-associated protein